MIEKITNVVKLKIPDDKKVLICPILTIGRTMDAVECLRHNCCWWANEVDCCAITELEEIANLMFKSNERV